MSDPRALVVAGVLTALDLPLPERDDAPPPAELTQAWHDASLWDPGEPWSVDPASGEPCPVLPHWVPPPALAPDTERSLIAWFPDDVAFPQLPVLRLGVRGVADALALRELANAGQRVLVPVVATRPHEQAWRWPLRVAVLPGTAAGSERRAHAWRDLVADNGYHGQQYDVVIADPDRPVDVDLVLAPGDALDDDRSAAVLRRAGAVLILAGTRSVADVLVQVLEAGHKVGAVLPGDEPQWWVPVFYGLTHDLPLDVSVTYQVPGALAFGDRVALDVTAVGRWASLAAVQFDLPELARFGAELGFFHESDASTPINAMGRELIRQGREPVVRIWGGETAAIGGDNEPPPPPPAPPPPAPGPPPPAPGPPAPAPGPAPPGPPPPAPAPQRFLTPDFVADGARVSRVLPPDHDVTLMLTVRLPRPEDDELVADRDPFPNPPAAELTTTLDVTVTSPVLAAAHVARMQLPVASGSMPSTPVAVPFRSPADGDPVTFDIVVSWRNRPLQTASVTAVSRAQALPGDAVQMVARSTSSPREPTERLRPADTWLDARDNVLRDHVRGVLLPLDTVREQLDAIDLLASRALGVEDAPDDLDDPRARELLVQLAVRGAQMRSALAGFDLDAAASVDLLVLAASPVLPLELVYAGPPPDATARLCPHHRHEPPPPGTVCGSLTRRTVCPFGFWGTAKRITRTVELAGVREDTPQVVTLNDVVYGAAAMADANAPADRLPSSVLAEAIRTSLPFRQQTPITSWTQWRTQVRERAPGVLVLLAHTQLEAADTSLLIGQRSFLAMSRLAAREVAPPPSPRPVVLLMACTSAAAADAFATLPGAFVSHGAAAVVGLLTKLVGRQAAQVGSAVVRELAAVARSQGTLGDALLAARRDLVAAGLLVGLFVLNHGDVDARVQP